MRQLSRNPRSGTAYRMHSPTVPLVFYGSNVKRNTRFVLAVSRGKGERRAVKNASYIKITNTNHSRNSLTSRQRFFYAKQRLLSNGRTCANIRRNNGSPAIPRSGLPTWRRSLQLHARTSLTKPPHAPESTVTRIVATSSSFSDDCFSRRSRVSTCLNDNTGHEPGSTPA